MNTQDNGENWVVIGPSHVELGPQVPAMVGNRSLTLQDEGSDTSEISYAMAEITKSEITIFA